TSSRMCSRSSGTSRRSWPRCGRSRLASSSSARRTRTVAGRRARRAFSASIRRCTSRCILVRSARSATCIERPAASPRDSSPRTPPIPHRKARIIRSFPPGPDDHGRDMSMFLRSAAVVAAATGAIFCVRPVAPVAADMAGRQESVGERIDRFVQAEMQRQHVPGVAIGVVKNGAVLKAEGYGYANLEHQVRVTPATIFQSGSLGKQFTAAAVMLQVDDGKLSLSDGLTTVFPDAPPSWRAITVQHVLTHTSGIPDYLEGTLDYRKDYNEDDLA